MCLCRFSSAGASRCTGWAADRSDFFHLNTVVEETQWKKKVIQKRVRLGSLLSHPPRVGNSQKWVAPCECEEGHGDFLTSVGHSFVLYSCPEGDTTWFFETVS